MADQLKDKEVQKYYEAMLSLCQHPGWKYLQEDVEKIEAAASNLRTVTDTQNKDFRLGQLDMIDWIKNRRQVLQAAYEFLLAEEDE